MLIDVTVRNTVIATVLLFVLATPTKAAPPVEAFGQLPTIKGVVISPGGTHYAAIQKHSGQEILAIYDLYGTPGKNAKFMSFKAQKGVEEELDRIFWANDERLIAVVEAPTYRRSKLGLVRTIETRMLSVSTDLSEHKVIPKLKKVKRSKAGNLIGSNPQFQDRVISLLPSDPDHILIELDREGKGWELNAYRLNIYTGSLQKLVDGPSSTLSYRADKQGQVRIRSRANQGKIERQIRFSNKESWSDWFGFKRVDGPPFTIDKFSADPNLLYVNGLNEKGYLGSYTYDVGRQGIEKEVYSRAGVDVIGVWLDPFDFRLNGVYYTEHFTTAEIFDSGIKTIQAEIDRKLPNTNNRITSYDRERKKIVVRASSSNQAPSYYLFMAASKSLLKIGDAYPGLASMSLAKTHYRPYAATDGLRIPAYLTKPEGDAPFPLVVLPHGGPSARDKEDFNYWVQFLVSRGYAVLQPNFRGSSGYGDAFMDAGRQRWGLEMQDDITDGVRTLIEEGVADKNRVCIVGGSYGGYAALMGAVKTPDLYRCAVSFAGVTSIQKMLNEMQQYKFSDFNRPRAGEEWSDRGRRRDTSPANNADNISASILLVHGENDRVVSKEHSELMARRLKSAGKPHKLVILEDGDHHLSLEKNRIKFLKELDAFLAQHMAS